MNDTIVTCPMSHFYEVLERFADTISKSIGDAYDMSHITQALTSATNLLADRLNEHRHLSLFSDSFYAALESLHSCLETAKQMPIDSWDTDSVPDWLSDDLNVQLDEAVANVKKAVVDCNDLPKDIHIDTLNYYNCVTPQNKLGLIDWIGIICTIIATLLQIADHIEPKSDHTSSTSNNPDISYVSHDMCESLTDVNQLIKSIIESTI